jgi:hypothetical protein
MANPSPDDDLGWTYPMMRNLIVTPIADAGLLTAAMTPVTAPVRAAGGISGTGPTLIVEHTGDNLLARFRFQFANVKMSAAEASFEAGGHTFAPGAFIIPNANRAQLEPVLAEYGLSAWAVASAPTVASHDLDVPRIGYIHSWGNTQDEGWVRAALDYYKIPYTYFGENEVVKRDLKQFDVILWPSGGAVGQDPPTTGTPVPYKKTAEFQALGAPDSSDDTRGGLGPTGLRKLYDFVQGGGTLITEGTTSSIFPQNFLTPGITIDQGQGLVAPGSIYRGVIADRTSPIVYGIQRNNLPVYYKTSGGPLFSVAGFPGPLAAPPTAVGAGRGGRGGAGGGSTYQNISPMGSSQNVFGTWDPTKDWTAAAAPGAATAPAAAPGAPGGRGAGPGAAAGGRGGGAGGGRGGGGGQGAALFDFMRPRVILQFPPDASDMLLSGGVVGAENLENHAQLIDAPIGKGHVVMFAIRPFWRWQTQGTFILGFNTLMNWNDLNAGK